MSILPEPPGPPPAVQSSMKRRPAGDNRMIFAKVTRGVNPSSLHLGNSLADDLSPQETLVEQVVAADNNGRFEPNIDEFLMPAPPRAMPERVNGAHSRLAKNPHRVFDPAVVITKYSNITRDILALGYFILFYASTE